MGWMHDTLEYMSKDALFRSSVHDQLTFRTIYQGAENYMLPLSHDEVVHGKGSLLAKMPGDDWQRFANLRSLLGYQWTVPGKKLLFMGGEFGSPIEWNHEAELPWASLEQEHHAGVQGWVRRLNELYRSVPALHQVDRDAAGFEWVVGDDRDQSVFIFLRHSEGNPSALVAMNLTPVIRESYTVGVPASTSWMVLANSDDVGYGGSGAGTTGVVEVAVTESHGKAQSITLDLPPLGLLILHPTES